jgi:glycosyltransferase involved in cell wall biosynthesis
VNILLLIENLSMGGAETFLVRLAIGLKKRGHTVVVSVTNNRFDESLAIRLHAAGITLIAPWWSNGEIYRWLFKLSTILPKGSSSSTLIDHLHSRFLRKLHRIHRFDVVNPHMTWAERRACLAFQHYPTRIVSTDHGDYRWKWSQGEMTAKEITFSRLNAVICPSFDNLRVVEGYPWSDRCQHGVIYYGYEKPALPIIERLKLEQPVKFCMVGRGGERTKGWDTAVEAFRILSGRSPGRATLTLVGAGPAVDEAISRLGQREREVVKLAGYQSDPFTIMARADVGLLPTRFCGESLPLVIIEFLAAGKPVLATNLAGIPEMLQANGGIAGELLEQDEGVGVPPARLAEAMELYLDPAHRQTRAVFAGQAAAKFQMDRCLDSYEKVFATGKFSDVHMVK